MHVAARSGYVDGPHERWEVISRMVLSRRQQLGLNQEQVAARTGGMASRAIVTALERCVQTSYRTQKLIGVSRALEWNDTAIEDYVRDGVTPEEQRPRNEDTTADQERLAAIEEREEQLGRELGSIRSQLDELLRFFRLRE